MAQYNGLAIISLEQLCTDYLTHLTPDTLQRKILDGPKKLSITGLEARQKSAKGVYVTDLALYLAQQRSAALKELLKINRL